MKVIRNHRMWICLNLILMILLSGMCYESVKADSLLLRLHTGSIESQQTAHHLNDAFFGGAQNEGNDRGSVRSQKSGLAPECCAQDRTYKWRNTHDSAGVSFCSRHDRAGEPDQPDCQNFGIVAVQPADDHSLYSPKGRSQRLTMILLRNRPVYDRGLIKLLKYNKYL